MRLLVGLLVTIATTAAGAPVRCEPPAPTPVELLDPTALSIAAAPAKAAGATPAQILGMRLLSNARGGVTIDGVGVGSDANQKGLRPGDVILAAAGRQTPTPEDLLAAIAQTRRAGRKAVLLLVTHAGDWSFVSLYVPIAKS